MEEAGIQFQIVSTPIWTSFISKWLDDWLLMGSVSLEDKLINTVWTMVRCFFASKQKPGKSHEKEERKDMRFY